MSGSIGIPGATGRRVATSAAWTYRPYRSQPSPSASSTTWVQIDLGRSWAIDTVRLLPTSRFVAETPGNGFPRRFRIEVAQDPSFLDSTMVFDHTSADFPDPLNEILAYPADGVVARYVRLTATVLRTQGVPEFALNFESDQVRRRIEGSFVLELQKIEVLADGRDVAVGCPVTVDPVHGDRSHAAQLTRHPRPAGEETLTDHPDRVTASDTWRPIALRATAPLSGVEASGRLFSEALDHNIRYLLDSFTTNDLVYRFEERAELPFSEPDRRTDPFWEDDLTGSNAGRFLMGAANTLRWREDAELRQRLTEVVDRIAAAQDSDGYLMAYPRDTFFDSERGAYTRSWVTQGLIEAGKTGLAKSFDMLRAYYDWYNRMPDLPRALRECGFGPQGTVANTRMYFTPVGKPEDLQTVQRYLQEDYWVAALASRSPDAVAAYPYDRQHSYLLTCIEPYADLYRATGETRYLDAVEGAWEMFRNFWQAPGGSISMIEFSDDELHANPLYEPRGETCGSAFWMLLNQRLHLLDPDQERYVTEIEKSIYNVILPNQAGPEGIRYHTMLLGKKEQPTRTNTCCEGQGTRLLGSLPEFIYSISDDGIYVDLFERSAITWEIDGRPVTLTQESDFPDHPEVALRFDANEPVTAVVRVRVPSWAAEPMPIHVNGEMFAVGLAGSYVPIERQWRTGDTVEFVLPAALRMSRYEGVDQVVGRERFSVEYGPVLLAYRGPVDAEVLLRYSEGPADLIDQLEPAGDPLHFSVATSLSDGLWLPYYELADELFNCVPLVRSIPGVL